MMIAAVAVFVLTYALIAAERLPKTVVALAGGLGMILLGIIDQHTAFDAIDFNVIFLLAGMMIIADVTSRTGMFQWAAIRSAKLARGEPVRILILLSLVTALASAVLDNVTTAVLIIPVTLSLASTMRLDPFPFLIAEVMAANIGGTATLIGDPPNILIGSAAGLSFLDFLTNLGPVILLILVIGAGAAWLVFRRAFKVAPEVREMILELDERVVITDPRLLRSSLTVLAVTLLGFMLHQPLGLEPATIALSGAVVLLLWTRTPVEEALAAVEWNTIFFFIGLFMLVEGVIATGTISRLAQGAIDLTNDRVGLSAMLILWVSGVASAIVDNVPYTVTLIPFVRDLGAAFPAHSQPLWWSLALGTCLGGNATPIGASANVLMLNLAQRAGHRITFKQFLGYGVPVTIGSLVISTLYLWLRYLM